MIESNSSIYLFPLHPVYNPEKTPFFESFSRENSVLFHSSLYDNFREVFEPFASRINIVYVFDDSDKEYLPEIYLKEGAEIFTGDTEKKSSLVRSLGDKYFKQFSNNIVFFANAIGITPADIEKVLNILSIEDEIFMVGKTSKEDITSMGFNSFNGQLFEEINWYDFKYSSLLRLTASHDHFLHVLTTDHQVIKELDDFRTLYKELSKKDSLAYCSPIMHERFTHLFIEYKELLK